MSTNTQTHSHCFVQWEDNKNEYAVVHVKRAKTPITLKTGLTTSFEGNNRDRRRGKILYIGTKHDCTVYSFEFEDHDGHVNTYTWSLAPGLHEQIEETAKAIKTINSENLHRTTSSSTSSTTNMTKNKKRKINNKEQNTTDEPSVIDVDTVPSPPPGSTFSTITMNAIDESSCSNNQNPSNFVSTDKSLTKKASTTTTSSSDNDHLLKENKALREKVFELEEELIYQRETSISLPSKECYDYFKSICSTYEHSQSEQSKKLIELSKELPCSSAELKLVKKPNPAATINNLIKCCFKEVDLREMSYDKLKNINSSLLENIYEFVKCVHAPTTISQTMFSGTISLKCRHLREKAKIKNDSVLTTKATKCKQHQLNNKCDGIVKRKIGTIHEVNDEQSEDNKENDEHF